MNNDSFVKYHFLKINEFYANDVLCGRKNFEVRKNDRGFQTGDKIIFEVVDQSGSRVSSKLNDLVYEITYVLDSFGLLEGFVVFGIKLYPFKGDFI